MKISTTIEAIEQKVGVRNAIRITKEAGFDCYDMCLFSHSKDVDQLMTSDDYVALAHDLRSYANELGIECNQTHTPFPTSLGDGNDEDRFQAQIRALEISSILGAKIAVVHPMQHLNYADHQRKLFKMNIDFYNRLLPYAEKFGIKIATENMWQCNNGAQVPSDSVCSRAWEFCEMIDTVNSPYLVGCLDIGHVSLMGADIPKFIRDMGADRLQALHVHDTDFIHDCHTLPYLQEIDFQGVADALGQIGYRGDFTFEAGKLFAKFPDALLLPAAKLMCETGKYLVEQIELAKQN